jgi:hypothetical protein
MIRIRIRIWIRKTARNDHGSSFTVEGVGSETVRMDVDRYNLFSDSVLDPDQTEWRKKC